MLTAYLILAHKNPVQLKRLIDRLKGEEMDIYVCLDAKVDLPFFAHLEQIPQVYFIRQRVNIRWGAYSLVEATLNAFEEIIDTGKNYDFIHLLSGQDYPLVSNKTLASFFEANKGKIFMQSLHIESEWQEAIPRYTRYHLTHYKFPGSGKIEQCLRLLPLRKFPTGLEPVGRSQWFSFGLQHAIYVVNYLKEHPAIKRFFKLTWAPDEFIFQSILYASPFRKDMVNDNLRCIEWPADAASPHVFTMADKDKLAASGKLFARKFDVEKDAAILDWIDEHLLQDK